jgi:gliding motility-associated-like protein
MGRIFCIIFIFFSLSSRSADYYWVGGSGNWSDISHWVTTSGGTVNHIVIPTAFDNVFFDANSFTGPGQVVFVNITNAVCRNLNWSGALYNPAFLGNNSLRIYGSFRIIKQMNFAVGPLYFESTVTGQTIITENQIIGTSIHFNGIGGEWILQDSLRLPLNSFCFIYLNNGHLNTNQQFVQSDGFYSTGTSTRTLTITGTTWVNGRGIHSFSTSSCWELNGTNLTFNSVNSTIIQTETGYYFRHTGTPRKYHNIVFNNDIRANWVSSGCEYNKVIFNIIWNSYQEGSGNNRIDTLIVNKGIKNHNLHDGLNNDTIGLLQVTGFGLLKTGCVINKAIFNSNATINGNNEFDSLILIPGNIYRFQYDGQQKVNQGILAQGNCNRSITIESTYNGREATIFQPAGSASLQRVSLRDIKADGLAVFIATSSVDLGNNSGINISTSLPKQLYWVGGSGNWDDPLHWSLISGGPGGACIPTAIDDVYFDGNSFMTSGSVIQVNISNAVCRNMDWTGTANNPSFSGMELLRIYGSFKLSPQVQWDYKGDVSFEATTTGKLITTAGRILDHHILFNGIGGEWILQDSLIQSFDSNILYLYHGHLNTNGQYIQSGAFTSDDTTSRILTIIGSTWRNGPGDWDKSSSWLLHGKNLELNSHLSNIIQEDTKWGFIHIYPGRQYYNVTFNDSLSTMVSPGCVYNKVTFNKPWLHYYNYSLGNRFDSVIVKKGMINSNLHLGLNRDSVRILLVEGLGIIQDGCHIGYGKFYNNSIINGNNFFDSLILSAGSINTFGAGSEQMIRHGLSAIGTCSKNIIMESSTQGQAATIRKGSGSITSNYVTLQDVHAAGQAIFTANNCVDLGNNLGWIINNAPPLQLYWVGGKGDWDDVSHWSFTSGGPGGACVPTAIDNVFFDANSFNSLNDTVFVNSLNATCHNMTWAGALYNPTFAGLNPFRIYGSLSLMNGMSWNYLGSFYFQSRNSGNTIRSSGNKFLSHVFFNGIGGEWILQDSLHLDMSYSNLYLMHGHLNTNGKNVRSACFYSSEPTIRKLTLVGSTWYNGIFYTLPRIIWEMNGTNLTLKADNSTIVFEAGNRYKQHLGAPVSYHNLVFNGNASNWYSENCSYNKITSNSAWTGYFGKRNKIDSVIINRGMYMGFKSDTINYYEAKVLGQLDGSCKVGVAKFFDKAILNGNNIYDTLIFYPGITAILQSGNTQTVSKHLQMRGNNCLPILLQASNAGSQSYIHKATGNVSADFVEMRDQRATGNAVFYAGNYSTNISNNFNWDFNNSPDYSYGLGADTIFCATSGPLRIDTDNFNGGISWLWSNGSNQPFINVSQTGNYWVKVNYAPGCTLTDSINIIAINPVTPLLSSNSPYCTGDTLKIFASPGNEYSWSGPNGFTSSMQNITIPNANASNAGSYTLRNSIGTCIGDPVSIIVSHFIPSPINLNISASDNDICAGVPVNFIASASNVGTAPIYSWDINGIPVGTNSPNFSSSTLFSNDIVRCTVSSIDGCGKPISAFSNSIKMIVTPTAPNHLLPNAFTPNNDGKNDCFGLSRWGNITDLKFKIFNRWGEIVFSTTNASDCWNGKFKGNDQPSGVFVYLAEGTGACGKFFVKGTVLLIR